MGPGFLHTSVLGFREVMFFSGMLGLIQLGWVLGLSKVCRVGIGIEGPFDTLQYVTFYAREAISS